MIRTAFLLFCLLCCFVQSGNSATTNCIGVLTGVFDDVVAPGPSCTLSEAEVRGSVFVNGGDFTTQINNTISGNLLIASTEAGSANLGGILQVNGGASVTNSPGVSLIVGPNVMLTSLLLQQSGPTSILGTVGMVQCTQCGSLSLDGATLFPGGLSLDRQSGDLTICSSNISGAVSSVSSNGKICVAESATCGNSTIDGTILVTQGAGDVDVRGAVLAAGDFIVLERTGNIVLAEARIGDVSLTKIQGSVLLTLVETESDGTYSQINGSVTIDQTTFVGDAAISFNTGPVAITGSSFVIDRSLFVGDVSVTSNLGPVTVSGSSFSLEDVLISNNAGPVVITDNTDANIVVSQNQIVTITGNNIVEATVNNNGNGTVIENNQFVVLRCSANDPAPTGAGNIVTELADGQCAGF